MGNYIWIILVIFLIAIAAYIKSTRHSEPENNGDERYLIGMGGMYKGQTFPIGNEVIIGRDASKCSIVYPNDEKGVSSVHCKVIKDGEKIAVTDLASRYGTFRDNGEKLSPNTLYYLGPGDGFYVGNPNNTFLVK